MRRVRFLALLLPLFVLALPVHAQERDSSMPRVSPNAVVEQQVGVTTVTVRYSRPSVRDREIFGGLVPYDEMWRTGANEATTITFSEDVTVEGEMLEAGTYGLFTIPGQDQWTIIFNDQGEQWGAFNYDESGDALRVQVTPTSTHMHEMMTFGFSGVSDEGATLMMHWAETSVPVEIGVNTVEILRDRAAEVQGSVYEALVRKAQLLSAAGDTEEAIAAGEEAIAAAAGMSEAPEGLDQLRQRVERWKDEQ